MSTRALLGYVTNSFGFGFDLVVSNRLFTSHAHDALPKNTRHPSCLISKNHTCAIEYAFSHRLLQATGGPEFFSEFKFQVKKHVADQRADIVARVEAQLYRVQSEATPCPGLKVVVVGAGATGLRAAVAFAMLGADVHVLERKNEFTRLDVVNLCVRFVPFSPLLRVHHSNLCTIITVHELF